MKPKETVNVRDRLSRNYALKILGKAFTDQVLQGNTSTVSVAKMGKEHSATEGEFMRLERGKILTTIEPESLGLDESVPGLIRRLNLVDVERARRCPLGTIIGRSLATHNSDGKAGALEWTGAGLDLLEATKTQFERDRKTAEYEKLAGRKILFAGILVGTDTGPSLVLLDLTPEGPKVAHRVFTQNDYDMEPGEMLIARGQVTEKKNKKR